MPRNPSSKGRSYYARAAARYLIGIASAIDVIPCNMNLENGIEWVKGLIRRSHEVSEDEVPSQSDIALAIIEEYYSKTSVDLCEKCEKDAIVWKLACDKA